MERFTTGSLKLLLPVTILALCHTGWAQSYGLGTTPSAEELRAADVNSIGPAGKELPPGSGTAKDGAQVYADKCAACHGDTGSGGIAPKLVKGATPKTPGPCLSPCINDNNVMALHSPYAATIWDYINRGMPFSKEGTLKPDEVYALTAFLLYKNGVVQEDAVLDAQSLPQIKMPNRDGYALPEWKDGVMRPLYRSEEESAVRTRGMYVAGAVLFLLLLSLLWVALRRGAKKSGIGHSAQSA